MKKPIKRKPQQQALAKRSNSKWNYAPSRRPASFKDMRGAVAPELDPQTRHALVTLSESVDSFRNLEERIAQLAGQVTQVENKAAETPAAHWRSMQHTISILQRDFRERITAVERDAANIEMIVSRMDRLEKIVEELQASHK